MKYVRGKQEGELEDLDTCRIRFCRSGVDGENMWGKRGKGYRVLQNHSLHLEGHSVGLILPDCSEIDLDDEYEFEEGERELYPEIFDYYVEKAVITKEGEWLGWPKSGNEEESE